MKPAAMGAVAFALFAGTVRAEERERPVVHVRVASPDPRATLTAVRQGTDGWTYLEGCPGTCERRLDPGVLYRVSGEGITPSRLFALPAGAGGVVVHVRPGAVDQHLTGAYLLGTGGLAVILSLVGWGLAARFADDPRTPLFLTSGGLGLASVGLGSLVLARSRTLVTVDAR